jgi:hypothetical protein
LPLFFSTQNESTQVDVVCVAAVSTAKPFKIGKNLLGWAGIAGTESLWGIRIVGYAILQTTVKILSPSPTAKSTASGPPLKS